MIKIHLNPNQTRKLVDLGLPGEIAVAKLSENGHWKIKIDIKGPIYNDSVSQLLLVSAKEIILRSSDL